MSPEFRSPLPAVPRTIEYVLCAAMPEPGCSRFSTNDAQGRSMAPEELDDLDAMRFQ